MNKIVLDIISKVIWALLCFICSLFIAKWTKVKKSIHNKEEDMNIIKDALRHTLRNILISDYNEFTRRGWCSHLEKEEYSATYDTYHSLNGNGVVTHKNDEVLNLPDEPPLK